MAVHTLSASAGHQTVRAVALAMVAAVCGGLVLVLQAPVLATEPFYAATNAIVTIVMVTVGSYMALVRRERFTGWCFVFAGVSWPLIVLDIYGGWGAYASFILGAGSTFFVPIVWGAFRYDRPRLAHRAERFCLGYIAFFTSGIGAVFSTFARPEWLGFPADAAWPSLWPDEQAFALAGAFQLLGFLSASVLFTVLTLRLLRDAPPLRRRAIRPLCSFGIALGFGASISYGTASFTDQLGFHQMTILIGMLAIGLTAALGFAMVRQDLLGGVLLERMPDALTPGEVADYLRDVLQDRTVELSFVDPRTGRLLDGAGRPVTEDRDDRFRMWVHNGSGDRIAMISGDPLLANDQTSIEPVRRMLTVLADNARLQVLLRLRVTELSAARTAEKLAVEHARESFQRDLHDGVQQTIAAARMDLEGLLDEADAAGRPEAEALSAKLGLALEQVQGLRSGGGPPELRFGLKPAVERTVAGLRLDATCTVTDVPLGVMSLPVYYIVREALTNVRKHAQAQHVSVEIACDGRDITIVVTDDGIGGAESSGVTGIEGIRRRVEDLGGHLTLSSPAGAGTTVRASLPHVS